MQSAKGLRFLVLDELHTYRGRQGSDVAMLVRRVRDRFEADRLQCVGTSATLASAGTFEEQRAEIARVASNFFGSEVRAENVIGETLRRATPDRNLNDPEYRGELIDRLSDPDRQPPIRLSGFRRRSAVDLNRVDRRPAKRGRHWSASSCSTAEHLRQEWCRRRSVGADGRHRGEVCCGNPEGLARRLPLPRPGHGVSRFCLPDPPVCQSRRHGLRDH